jgi:hypothetical protein
MGAVEKPLETGEERRHVGEADAAPSLVRVRRAAP